MFKPRHLLSALAATVFLAPPALAQGGHDHHGHPAPKPSGSPGLAPQPSPQPSVTPASPQPAASPDAGAHEGHGQTGPEAVPDAPDHSGHGVDHTQMDHGGAMLMPGYESHAAMAADPLMQRARTLGSGTALLPATSPMRMWAVRQPDWLWMLHGDVVGGLNHQGGPRGTTTHAAENWAMLMGTRYLGPGILDLRLMGSLEPWTLPPGGTPQLFQTGETYQNRPLRDQQHPHDLFMELAARYTWTLSDRSSIFAYGALAGEPALGPVAFMHRPSAADNHWAPLAHHLQDSTHITYGVTTLGARYEAFQLEGSLFNGREPGENRVGFDFGPLDSWSTRLSWVPSPNWVAQVSYGQLKSPEALLPGDIHRTTASVANVQPFPGGTWSNSLVWGQNKELHDGVNVLQSYGVESQVDWLEKNHAYGRLELVDKTGLDLGGDAHDHGANRVLALTLGGIRDLDTSDKFDLGLGADATVYSLDQETRAVYGENPVSFRVYLRLRPPTMQH
jgi:hypothetical protein